MKKVKLPDNPPRAGDSQEDHAAWVSRATRHEVLGTWRSGRSDRTGMLVRLGDGHELVFDTIGEAERRLVSAFMALDGVEMPSYTAPQVRTIVAALVRMAEIDHETDEREEYADIGARFLRGCLIAGGRLQVTPDDPDDRQRLLTYQKLLLYADGLSRLNGDPGERWPEVLHATDRQRFYLPRGLFLRFARKTLFGIGVATLNFQMRRLGWEDIQLRPRKPKDQTAERPHLRLWQIEEGWQGITANPYGTTPENNGPASTSGTARDQAMVPPGLSEASRARARTPALGDPGGTMGPRRGALR